MSRVSSFADRWQLDPSVRFLNHGSFGACPTAVLEHQSELRRRLEAEPVRFMVREYEGLLDDARRELAEFTRSDPSDLVFVSNVTAAINAVLRSLEFQPGDEIVTTNHAYNAAINAMDFVAERTGARVIVSEIDLPIFTEDEVVEAILDSVSGRTKLAVLDHVTSPTAVIFPIGRIVAELSARGIPTLVDGAHTPGMMPLNIPSLGAAFYAGNLHKWVCAPKGAGFLWVRSDLQHRIRPLAISHGANSPRTDRSRFHLEFDWTGTDDPTAIFSVPKALRYVGGLMPAGWPEIMLRNRLLVLDGRDILKRSLRCEHLVPESMTGSMAVLPLPDGADVDAPALYGDPLQDILLERYGIEVPVIVWPHPPHRLLRISAQLYNTHEDYTVLGEALIDLLVS
jgi:isopenicillin-N epimerase